MKALRNSLLLASALIVSSTAGAIDWTQLAAHALASTIANGEQKSNRSGKSSPGTAEVALPPATGNFGSCREYFANGEAPVVPNAQGLRARALCFNGFAVLHSGKTKTPIFSAEVLSRASLAAARDEKRTDVFFEDARLPSAERATLEDFRGSGFDRGHLQYPVISILNA